MEKYKIYDGINSILSDFEFKENTDDNRKILALKCQDYLRNITGINLSIIDATTSEMIDQGFAAMCVLHEGKRMGLEEFISNIFLSE